MTARRSSSRTWSSSASRGGEYRRARPLTAYDVDDRQDALARLFAPAPTRTCWSIPQQDHVLGKPIGENSAIDTWEGDQWQIGGGTTWGWYSYDPELT